MSLRRNFLTLCLLGSGIAAHGQSMPEANGAEMQTNLKALVDGMPANIPHGTADLKGSPYADPRWLAARLTVSNNKPLAPLALKYDVLNKRLLMRENFKVRDSLRLDDRLVTGFTLEEPAANGVPARQRVFRRFLEAPDEKTRANYVEVLHEGKYTLLKQYVKTVRKADYQNAYSNDRRFDEIEDKPLYFLRRPNGSLVAVKLNQKSLSSAAPELGASLKKATPKTEQEWAAALQAADPR